MDKISIIHMNNFQLFITLVLIFCENIFYLTHWGPVMQSLVSQILVNLFLGNDFISGGIKPLPELMTCNQWGAPRTEINFNT